MPPSAVRRYVPFLVVLAALLAPLPAAAQDSVVPAEVEGLSLSLLRPDLALAWTPVTQDATGQPELIDHYRVYRGSGPRFPEQFDLVGLSAVPNLADAGAGEAAGDYYYVVTAVDQAGNEGGARPSSFTSAPQLSGFWTATTIELTWTDAAPASEVAGYRVYWGPSSRTYRYWEDVGSATAHSLGGLEPNRNWYAAVVAIDAAGNLSPFSNEHVDALAGTIDLRAHDESRLCYGGCPAQEGEIVRNAGREIMLPVDFPEGDWVNVTLTFTADSRLCDDPIAPDKCGSNNPGWNPCGDPWDRTASVYLVLDGCIDAGTNCYGQKGNLELIRTITPFGTDAPEPDGSGEVPPAVWTFDVTPYAGLLSGTKHVGAFIATWVSPGWYVTVEFHFSEDPLEASPEPPADGVAQVWFRDGGNSTDTTPVTIPVEATQVMARLFTTGHGGVGKPECDCPARPCDEFCSKWVEVLVDGFMQTELFPWRDDCSPLGENVCGEGTCDDWNACGCPSCTYNRAGWCPGYLACHENEPCDQDFDATGWFTPGTTHDVNVNVRDMTPGAAWANSLVIYWYETP